MLHVGISGAIAAGKTTLAERLKRLSLDSGLSCEVISFAAGIRELLSLESEENRMGKIQQRIYGWGWNLEQARIAAFFIDQHMIQYPSEPGVKNRKLMQIIGTEIGRDQIDKAFWIYRTKQLIRGHVLDFAISDDVRFDNEVMAIDVHVRISLSSDRIEAYNSRLRDLGHVNHASERSLTLAPLFSIPVAFTDDEVYALFYKLNEVRKLRI